eukprot:jgi/Bigna1/76099/fgenesh1_pg.39_\
MTPSRGHKRVLRPKNFTGKELYRITYRSRHRSGMTTKDIDDVVERAALHNESAKIGGSLWINEKTKSVRQVLEGLHMDIEPLVERIANDPRHHKFFIEREEFPSARFYPKWGASAVIGGHRTESKRNKSWGGGSKNAGAAQELIVRHHLSFQTEDGQLLQQLALQEAEIILEGQQETLEEISNQINAHKSVFNFQTLAISTNIRDRAFTVMSNYLVARLCTTEAIVRISKPIKVTVGDYDKRREYQQYACEIHRTVELSSGDFFATVEFSKKNMSEQKLKLEGSAAQEGGVNSNRRSSQSKDRSTRQLLESLSASNINTENKAVGASNKYDEGDKRELDDDIAGTASRESCLKELILELEKSLNFNISSLKLKMTQMTRSESKLLDEATKISSSSRASATKDSKVAAGVDNNDNACSKDAQQAPQTLPIYNFRKKKYAKAIDDMYNEENICRVKKVSFVFKNRPLGFRIELAGTNGQPKTKRFRYICIPTTNTELLRRGIIAGSGILSVNGTDVTHPRTQLKFLATEINKKKRGPVKITFAVILKTTNDEDDKRSCLSL